MHPTVPCPRPCAAAVLLAAGLLLAGTPARGDPPPNAPSLGGVDHARPASLVALPDHVGAGVRTQAIARQLAAHAAGPREVLGRIARWIDRNLREDDARRGQWRPADTVLEQGTVGGPADRAFVFGVLARSAGIPAAWVEALPIAWLTTFRAGRTPIEPDVERIYLEVHVDGAWRLLDPVTARLYERHDPSATLLPGDHLAYDRGGDPYTLVLPNRLEAWRVQVGTWARGLDPAAIPWAATTDLLAPWRVWIAGGESPARYAAAAARALGHYVETGLEGHWEERLAALRGTTLIVTLDRGEPALPAALRDAWLPPGWREASAQAGAGRAWMAHRRPDGTRVVLVTATEYGPVELAVSEALER